MHDRRFSCVQNHMILRYVRGWKRIDPDEQGAASFEALPGDHRMASA